MEILFLLVGGTKGAAVATLAEPLLGIARGGTNPLARLGLTGGSIGTDGAGVVTTLVFGSADDLLA